MEAAMPASQHIINVVPVYRFSLASIKAKPSFVKRLTQFGEAMVLALMRSREKEAARIVALQSNDRWTDGMERDIADVYCSSVYPPQRDWPKL